MKRRRIFRDTAGQCYVNLNTEINKFTTACIHQTPITGILQYTYIVAWPEIIFVGYYTLALKNNKKSWAYKKIKNCNVLPRC